MHVYVENYSECTLHNFSCSVKFSTILVGTPPLFPNTLPLSLSLSLEQRFPQLLVFDNSTQKRKHSEDQIQSG